MWRWTNPERFRSHQADLVKDLFGGWLVIRACGGLGSRQGQARSTAVCSCEDGLARIEANNGTGPEGPHGLGP